MSTLTLEQALQRAMAHHQAGQLAQAEAFYRQILAVQPQQPDALHLLGVIASQVGQPATAVELIEKAIAVQPGQAAYHTNLGEAYRAQRQLDAAITEYQKALALAPNIPETHNNLGIALYGKGRMEEAIACYELAIALRPAYAEAHSNLGNAWLAGGQWEQAIASCQRALGINPGFAEAHHNLGVALKGTGQSEAAIASFERALALRPDYAEAYINLGAALYDAGRIDDAIACYQKAISIQPDGFTAYNNLGTAFCDKGQLGEAIACYYQALALQPDSTGACLNLGNALTAAGEVDQAIASCRRAVTLEPDSPNTQNSLGNALFHGGHIAAAIECYQEAVRLSPNNPLLFSNLVYTLHFDPTITPQELADSHQEWNRRFAVPLRTAIGPHANDPDPNRRLKIGYVSPDFYAHACGHFLLPLFEAHDHTHVEVYCYATNVRKSDAISNRLQQAADVWRDVRGMSDEAMAQLIREDGIDILVDLSLHMADNRLLVFARKPAPVQASWLGYPGITGLDTIDYRLTDAYLEPPDSPQDQPSEQAIFLPDAFGCYDPFIEADEAPVNELPVLTGQPLTFGNLNNFSKISPPILALWARVLREVPGSRLLLLASAGSHQQRMRDTLQAQSVAPERLEFLPKQSRPQPQYLALYHQIDLMLDTLPYSGHTTLCDALWMGVPVVTLAGKTAVGRGGVSILSNVGLPELIAHSEDEYVKIAVDLASDLPRLTELRATLRERMLASPLMDGPRFARGIEAAYRQMWTTWCQGRPLK